MFHSVGMVHNLPVIEKNAHTHIHIEQNAQKHEAKGKKTSRNQDGYKTVDAFSIEWNG